MEITVAKSAGFCFGVKRAVDLVYSQIEEGKTVCTFGPIIHNERVVDDLGKKGVRVISSAEDLAEEKDVTVVIRSHGVDKKTLAQLEKKGGKTLDATCPFVKKIHGIVKEHSENGYQIVVAGDAGHPEVWAICGWSVSPVKIIEDEVQAGQCDFPPGQKVCVVAQTTFNLKKFQDIVAILSKKSYDIKVMHTICNATKDRQAEAAALAKASDAMIVIGGENSSNTRKLAEICRAVCGNTQWIQTPADLDLKRFQSVRSVGITAGASTPNTIIKEVQSYVRHGQRV